MEARVEITKFYNQQMAASRDFLWKSFTAYIGTGSSIPSHNIALFLFNNKIGLYQWQEIIQHWAGGLPVINWSRKLLLASPSIARIFGASKSILKPDNKLFVAARYLKHGMPLVTVAVFTLFCIADVDTTFSIDKSCKIGDLSNSMLGFKMNSFSHELPFVNNYIVINEKVYAERLSEKALNRDAIV